MKTDILHTLQAVLLENTTSYQSDFEFDVTTLLEAAKEPKIEDRTYYWLSRPCGTWCLKERDVFLKGSAAYNIWTHYESEHDGFRAFRVVIEEKNDWRKRPANQNGGSAHQVYNWRIWGRHSFFHAIL